MYYGGESRSILFPEKKSNEIFAKRLMGVFSDQRITRFPSSLPIIGISLSRNHALAWTTGGSLYAWGCNVNGVLGIENNENLIDAVIQNPTPVKVGLGDNPGINYAMATSSASFVINFRGRIYYWGR